MRFLDKRTAFTIVELLVVISIILILLGLLSPAVNRARKQARVQKTKAMIGSLEVACSMFFNDIGNYPDSLSDLVNDTGDTQWQGPYIEPKEEYYSGGDFIDAWGNAFTYTEPGANNTNSFDLSSGGPTDEDDDNIDNW